MPGRVSDFALGYILLPGAPGAAPDHFAAFWERAYSTSRP